jgi:hypothetical protein
MRSQVTAIKNLDSEWENFKDFVSKSCLTKETNCGGGSRG